MKPHPVMDPANFWRASGYLVVLAVAGAIVVELFKDLAGEGGRLAALLVLGAGCVVISAWAGFRYSRAYQDWQKRRDLVVVGPVRARPALAAKALVALAGPREDDPARQAVMHHLHTLDDLWLVTSSEGRERALRLREEAREAAKAQGREIRTHELTVVDDPFNIEEMRAKVHGIRQQAIGRGIAEEDLVCDFTGMTKQSSIGMVLACAARQARLEYMHGTYVGGELDRSKKPMAIEVDTAYEVAPESF